MSFGSLSGSAVEALNRGAALAGCLQNTGEGGTVGPPPARWRAGLPDRHGVLRLPGRPRAASTSHGSRTWSPALRSGPWRSRSARAPSRASVGAARPKVSAEIAADSRRTAGRATASAPRGTRSSPTPTASSTGSSCSPTRRACRSGSSRRSATAVLVRARRADGPRPVAGVDFVTIDGGEGGTGAAPLIFTDSVSVPFQLGFARVYSLFARAGAARAGRVHGRRQARPARQRDRRLRARLRHGECGPRGDARDRLHPGAEVPHRHLSRRASPRRTPGWPADWCPALKSVRVANYITTLRRDLVKVAEACGVEHPGLIESDVGGDPRRPDGSTPLRDVYGYEPGWVSRRRPTATRSSALMTVRTPQGGSRHRRRPPSADPRTGPRKRSGAPRANS